MAVLDESERFTARRVRVGDRIVVLPPNGQGERWHGSALATGEELRRKPGRQPKGMRDATA
jgi:hypothetical protein